MPAFFATTLQPTEWKYVAASVKTVMEEATFLATPAGIVFKSMDEQKYRMVRVWFPAVAFEKFECPEPYKFAVRTENFAEIMSKAEKTDKITMHSEPGGEFIVNLGKREFGLHLVESGEIDERKPTYDPEVECFLDLSAFDSILSQAEIYSDEFYMRGTKDGLEFFSKGDDGHFSASYPKEEYPFVNEENKVLFEWNGPQSLDDKGAPVIVEGLYTTPAIRQFLKTMSGLPKTELAYATKKMLQLGFDLNNQGTMIQAWFSPRIVTK